MTFVEFGSLFNPKEGVPGIVVSFLAMLELAREHLINLSQAEAFAPIYVRLAFAPLGGASEQDSPVYEVEPPNDDRNDRIRQPAS